jgi:hypothetical protein
VLLLAILYWPGLTGWFFQDDFGWLRLRQHVQSPAELFLALFAPEAHGNMRPLGENAYWLALSSIFGIHPLPFRLCAFVTASAAALLLGGLARRLAKSASAGFWAPVIWVVNRGVGPALGWSSIYNQLLSSFFFLLALYFLVRYAETGERRYYRRQWAAFVLGLGALETNVMYPAVALLYAWLFARPLSKKILPMFAVSAAAAAIHFAAAPAPREGLYAPRVDLRLFSTFWTYWQWSFGSSGAGLGTVMAAVLLLAGVWLWRRGEAGVLFGLGWFALVTAPYLPLPDHKMDYYLAAPAIGLALAGGCAATAAWRSRLVWKAAAGVALAAYLLVSVPAAWRATRWQHDRSLRVEDFVLGVEEIRRADPDKTILLDGVDDDLFHAAIADLPFLALRIPAVYLAPGPAEAAIHESPELLTKFTLPPEMARSALDQGRALVYRVDGHLLRNETRHYRETLAASGSEAAGAAPRFVNIGDPVFAEFLEGGWGAAAGGYRALLGPGGAGLRIGGPRSAGEHLYIGIFRTRDFEWGLKADDAPLQPVLVYRDTEISEFRAGLPPGAAGTSVMHLSIETPRESLTFGYAEIR